MWIHPDYKPRKISDAFEGRYVGYKSDQDKKSSLREYLEKIRHLI